MTVEGNPFVLVILAVCFAAVVAFWFFWSRNQSRVVRRYAESKGLVHHDRDPEGLEARVNACVALDDANLTRTFSRFGDIVSLGRGTLFRAVELLDLNPYGRADYANRSRVGVWFRCPFQHEGFFLVTPALGVHQRYPEEPDHTEDVRGRLEAARVAPPPCTLSLTLMRDHAVAYLEPTVTGTVTAAHLDYLAGLVNALAR
jgi:hypothetical protein